MQYSIGLFEGLVICYLWGGGGGEWWRCPFREILKDFQTDPPIHHSFLEMASYCTYCESDVSPVRRGNYKIIPWIQILPKFTTHFFYSGCLLFMAVTLNFISCSLLLCTTFMTFYNDPPGNAPLCENDPQQNGHTLFTGNKWPAPDINNALIFILKYLLLSLKHYIIMQLYYNVPNVLLIEQLQAAL